MCLRDGTSKRHRFCKKGGGYRGRFEWPFYCFPRRKREKTHNRLNIGQALIKWKDLLLDYHLKLVEKAGDRTTINFDHKKVLGRRADVGDLTRPIYKSKMVLGRLVR